MGKGLYEVLKDVEANTKEIAEVNKNLRQIAESLKLIVVKLENYSRD